MHAKRVLNLAAGLALATAALAAQAAAVKLAPTAPFAPDSNATDAVRAECQLTTQVPEAVKEAAGDSVELGEGGGGRVLKLRIGHVLGVGGPFLPKSVSIEGELVEGGKTVGSFHARRQTTGGATCAALAKCARTLGKDIAEWLAAPAMDSKLGNAK
ncbi:MAG TPA: hypothetical protein VM074_00795 [Solimonas sp.]|nr:hypothetical protein [Solimonas sp.]